MSADQLTPTAHVSPTEDATYRKVTWRLIPLLLVCYILHYSF